MKLTALLVCRDPETTRAMRRILDELGIAAEVHDSADEARTLLKRTKYDAVVVDTDELRGGPDLLASVRGTPSNRRAIVLAVVSGRTSMSAAFLMGADFVLSKPISPERTKRNLEVARAFMIAERRRYQRHAVGDAQASLDYGFGGRVEAEALDVSEGGMKIRADRPVQPNWIIHVHLRLPDLEPVDVKAEVTWADEAGNAGVRFISLPRAFHARYRQWLDTRSSAKPQVAGRN